ncbi:MAG: hypothetical protein IJ174_07460 [Clostridia bacterium]|nr:hypothetical protein [Clostridia bacterium]
MIQWMQRNWSWLLSAFTFLSGGFFGALKWLRLRKKRMQCLENGLQALLRASMIAEYMRARERGFAPIYARDNFQNLWEQYEALGKNGVMNGIRERFMALPLEPAKEEDP